MRPEDEGRFGGTGLGDALVTFVEHSFHAAEVGSGKNDVSHTECAVLHEHCGHIAAALVKRRFDDRTGGAAVRIGLEVEEFGFEKHFLHEVLYSDALLGRDVLRLVFAAPFLYEMVHLGQLFLDLVRVCSGLVDLVDGEYDGHTGSRGMVDGLDGLRHDIVISSDDNDTEVGHFGTAGTHGGEGLMARSVKEGDVAAVREFHVIGTDMLGDAAGLACDHVGIADIVEKRSLAVVYVAHDGHDRRAGHEFVFRILFLLDGFHNLSRNVFGLVAEFLGHDVDGLGVETLVDRHHHTKGSYRWL